jgi:carbon dioxide concentrating mechanism protein CcmN
MNLENIKIMQSNYLPPLEPIGDFRSYVCGDVVIDQTAAIASGVLIQADQGGRITIAAGACIGMGAVLHAQDGLLEIGAGANLGAGVLVYGTCKIGEGACIGASSSIVRAVIGKGAIVPPCSLISGLEQSAVEKEVSPAIAQELEINTYISPTNHSFTHTYSSAKPLGNQFMQGSGFRQGITTENIPNSTPDNIVERSTYVDGTVTETQVELPIEAIADQSLATDANEQNEQTNTGINPLETDISTLTAANSAIAKAHAQSQINRFIKRLYPQN